MRFRRSMWLGTALVAAALVTGVRAFAQQTFDHPTYKGNNARQGKNSDPTHNSPGKSNLRWWTPNGTGTSFFQPIIDDTDTNPTTVVADGPYDPNPYGFIQSTAGWFGPGTDEEASMAYTLPIRRIPTGTASANYNLRAPAYRYATCAPTLATPYDPRVAAAGTTLRTFTWNFTGEGNTPKNYSIYVNIPVGPTKIGGVNHFPQRFFTYEISWGPGGNQKFIDIVDTYASGGGQVRLGSGGRPGNVVFPYDGRNPITVKLFNTVPRDQNGKLTMKVLSGGAYQGMDNYLVYADAIKFAPATGSYAASPSTMRLIDGNPLSAVVTAANNELTVGLQNGVPTTIEKGVVTNYTYNSGQRWRFSPLEESGYPFLMDNTGNMSGDFLGENVKRAVDPDAAVAPITNTAPGSGFVTYDTQNSLTDQTYDIYVYIPGSFSPTRQYATRTTYTVYAEGTQFTYRVDQSVARGWVRLGNRRFRNIPPTSLTAGQPIQVVVSNYSPRAADLGKYAYSDAIRFVGEQNQQITSTPIHASALIRKNTGVTEETKVVLVADENGVIHCLDALGNGDGTTTEYWSYPSLRDKANYDPNLGSPTAGNGPDYNGATDVPAAERTPTAEMPQGFDLSSGLVQRIGGVDYLFIGTSNGRVYCINMAGRGDYDTTDPQGGYRLTGTTTRKWTFPSTYPAANAIGSSDLLQIRGSVAYGEPNSEPTIFIPTMSGRLYAVDAAGNADTSTNVKWTFPSLTQQHLGPIAMTPAVAFNRVYFGTLRNALTTGDIQGQFYAVDWTNGNLVWGRQYDDDFLASPAVATGAELEPANPTPGTGLVFAANQNRNVIAFDPDTGAEQWFTNIGSGVEGSLTFTWQTVYNNLGTLAPFPVVVVPTQSGHFYSLFARTADVDQFGTRLAWGYQTAGTVRASMAVQGLAPNTNPLIDPPTGWMYGADDLGFLYAFNNDNGYLVNGIPPGAEDLTPNNPLGQVFRKTMIKVIKRSEYQRLRLPTKLTPPRETAPPYDYTMAYPDAKAIVGQNPANLAFEWGQTAYILVYNFPFVTQNSNSQTVDPPIVNVSFSMNGKTVRGVAVQARQFSLPDEPEPDGPPTYNTADAPGVGSYPALDPSLGGDEKMDGYAILAFPFQNSGANSLPPGDGEISISISTASLNSNNIQQNVLLNPAVGASRFPFKIANPLAVIMPGPGAGGALSGTYRGDVPGASNFSFGLSNNPADVENLGNGSFNVAGKNGSLLGASTDVVGHGTTGKSVVWVVDRSMMSLLRPDGVNQGLDGVRMDRRDLGWQGGAATVYKKINSYGASYDGFEDLPVNSPNNSISYPDIFSDRLSVTKDPAGNAENPLFNGVTLLPPLKANGDPIDEDTAPTDRVFRVTPFEIDVDVPRFQPPNWLANLQANATASMVPNSAGSYNEQGYIGRLDVFVDSAQNGKLDTTTREAYRSFNFSTAVGVDERLSVTTPTVDLGTLPAGFGYYPGFTPGGTTVNGPSTNDHALNPWGGDYGGGFKTFGVQNEGNVNLLNVRVAKSSTYPWPFDRLRIGAGENDGFAWLDGLFDVWSDIDPQFGASPITGRPAILPKARVQDRVPSSLQSNPIRRENPNLGKTGLVNIGGNIYRDALNTTPDNSGTKLYYRHGDNATGQSVHSPVVGVSVPIGFPVGKYQERVRVFEDYQVPNNVWDGNATSAESYTEPGFLLSFNVAETRLTSSPTTVPMVDSLAPNGAYGAANLQPAAARDAFGSLLLAWSSNRPNLTTAPSTTDTGAYRLYLSALDSGATFSTSVGGNIAAPGESPLRDLNAWNPGSATHWFKPYTGATNGYPSVPDASIFGLGAGEAFVGPVRYGNPSFPSAGEKNPFGSDYFNGMYMAFTGQTQRKNADNTVQNDSRLLLSVVSANGAGNISISDPFVLSDNPQAVKGKPAVIQGGSSGASSAIVLYPATSAGTSSILYTRFDPSAGFHKSQVLPLGTGFSTVTSPSASARIANPGLPGGNRPVIDFTFQGKLRGRPFPEAFLGRLNVVVPGSGVLRLPENADGTLDVANLYAPLPPETDENIQAEAEAGLYRARGVYWDISKSITLTQILGTVSTNLLIDGTQAYDQQTGIISYNSKLGGKVYLDPALGTVRFSNSVPSRNARIQLSYTPRFLRVSAGGAAGYYDPVGLFDNRLITDASYWRLANGNQADLTSGSRFSGPLTNDRLLFTYNRAASGAGQAARPYMYSVRFGVRLDFRLPTLPNGVPGFIQGTNTRDAVQRVFFPPAPPADIGDGFGQDAYQIDAAQGRIYFPAADEGRLVRISYYAVDSAGNLILDAGGRPQLLVKQAIVSLLAETGETAIPIETSVNESNLVPTLDPFSYANAGGGSQAYRRPPLVWLFWTSTRNGTPDLYFQSIAPRWSPIPIGH